MVCEDVNERYSTQTGSYCGSRRDSPQGRAGLGIREWACGECGITHSRPRRKRRAEHSRARA